MSNFYYLENKQNDLCYISLNYALAGRIYANENAIYAQYLYNEGLSDSFLKKLQIRAIEMYADIGFFDFGINMLCLKKELDYALKALEESLNNLNYDNLDLVAFKIKSDFALENDNNNSLSAMNLMQNYFKNGFKNGYFADYQNYKLNDIKNYFDSLKTKPLRIVASANLNAVQEEKLKNLSKEISFDYEKLEINASFDYGLNKDISQSFITFVCPLIMHTLKDSACAKILSFILGGGFGSLLMEEIRVKKGLAYSVYAHTLSYKNNHTLKGAVQTKNESKEEVKKIILDILSNNELITKEHFLKAKEYIIGSEVLQYQTIAKRHTIAQSEIFSNKKLSYNKELLECIKNTDFDDFKENIKKQDLSKVCFFTVGKNG